MIATKFLFCLVAFAVCLANAEEDGRIVNGMQISIKQAPYMIQIRSENLTFCGGSLIAPKYVATAAHCVLMVDDVKDLVLVSGATNTSEVGVQRTVIRHGIHPDYTPKTQHSDIAIIELNAPIFNTPTLKLCQQSLKEGDLVRVSGWGRIGEDLDPSPTLLSTMLPVRSQQTCKKEFGSYVDKNMICLSGLEATGHCFGDSGGPAVYKGQLCGTVAFSYKCGKVDRPAGYTDVYAVRSFIEKFMSDK